MISFQTIFFSLVCSLTLVEGNFNNEINNEARRIFALWEYGYISMQNCYDQLISLANE